MIAATPPTESPTDTDRVIVVFGDGGRSAAAIARNIESMADSAEVRVVDVWEWRELAIRHRVTALPTTIAFWSGVETGRLVGPVGRRRVARFVDRHVSPSDPPVVHKTFMCVIRTVRRGIGGATPGAPVHTTSNNTSITTKGHHHVH